LLSQRKPKSESFFRRHGNKMFVGACIGAGLLVAGFVVASVFSAGTLPAIVGLFGLAALSVPLVTGLCVGVATVVGAVAGTMIGAIAGEASDSRNDSNQRVKKPGVNTKYIHKEIGSSPSQQAAPTVFPDEHGVSAPQAAPTVLPDEHGVSAQTPILRNSRPSQ
jgi:hypothetical protein